MNTYRGGYMDKQTKEKIPGFITEDLGYCCLWAFFTRNKRTGMIALRLGVSDRAVRLYKARHKAGEFKCECKGNCLKARIAVTS